jgi:hypothetical protein
MNTLCWHECGKSFEVAEACCDRVASSNVNERSRHNSTILVQKVLSSEETSLVHRGRLEVNTRYRINPLARTNQRTSDENQDEHIVLARVRKEFRGS